MNKILVGLLASGVLFGLCAQAGQAKMPRGVKKYEHKTRKPENINVTIFNSTPEEVQLRWQLEDEQELAKVVPPFSKVAFEQKVTRYNKISLDVKKAGDFKEELFSSIHGPHGERGWRIAIAKYTDKDVKGPQYEIISEKY